LAHCICKALVIETTDRKNGIPTLASTKKKKTHTHTHTNTRTHTHTHKQTNQYVKVKMLQCLGIKGVNTDRKFEANRPDKLTKNYREKRWIPIDVAIPADRNVTKRKQNRN
jgi:hypothetical protein